MSSSRVVIAGLLTLALSGVLAGVLAVRGGGCLGHRQLNGDRPATSSRPLRPVPYDDVWRFFTSHPVPDDARSTPPAEYDYKFTVAGHIRSEVDHPLPFIRAFGDGLAHLLGNSEALVLLGDIQTTGDPANWDMYDALIRERVSIPVLLALGNHDVLTRPTPKESLEWYRDRYGLPYFATRINRSLAVVLCTEPWDGDLDRGQLNWLLNVIDQAKSGKAIDHVFVFMHRVMWFAGHERYRGVLRLANNSSIENHHDLEQQLAADRAFWRRVFPKLRELAELKCVYVMAGDVGRRAPLIYDHLDGVHLLATGCRGYLREQTWNHAVEVYVKGPEVWLHSVSLDGVSLARPEFYNLSFWADLDSP